MVTYLRTSLVVSSDAPHVTRLSRTHPHLQGQPPHQWSPYVDHSQTRVAIHSTYRTHVCGRNWGIRINILHGTMSFFLPSYSLPSHCPSRGKSGGQDLGTSMSSCPSKLWQLQRCEIARIPALYTQGDVRAWQEVKNIKITMCSPSWFHQRHGSDQTYDHSIYKSDGSCSYTAVETNNLNPGIYRRIFRWPRSSIPGRNPTALRTWLPCVTNTFMLIRSDGLEVGRQHSNWRPDLLLLLQQTDACRYGKGRRWSWSTLGHIHPRYQPLYAGAVSRPERRHPHVPWKLQGAFWL